MNVLAAPRMPPAPCTRYSTSILVKANAARSIASPLASTSRSTPTTRAPASVMVKKSSWPPPGLAQRQLQLLDLVVGGERAHQRRSSCCRCRFVTTRCLYWRRAVACPEPIAERGGDPELEAVDFDRRSRGPWPTTSPLISPARLVRTLRKTSAPAPQVLAWRPKSPWRDGPSRRAAPSASRRQRVSVVVTSQPNLTSPPSAPLSSCAL